MKINKISALFLYFFKIGWFTFGGGWSIVAQMQKDIVDDQEAISSQELLDIVSVGRSLPGTMIGNVAYLFGYHQCGVAGGVAAVIGIILPPMIILSIFTWGYEAFRDNVYIAKALVGIRAAVVPIIASAAVKLKKDAFPHKFCYVLCGARCILSAFFKVNCILIILGGIICGLLYGKWKEGK